MEEINKQDKEDSKKSDKKTKADQSVEEDFNIDKEDLLIEEDPTRIHIEKKPFELVKGFWEFIKSTLSLRDKFNVPDIMDEIRGGIVFSGYNVWILVCSILVASVGLNVNSIPVIIGAMLISPLMGPIRGIGFGVAMNDFRLLMESVKNFGVMVGISLATSIIYFLITPIDAVTSELFGRTEPNFLDVIIAFFGGLAGVIAAVKGQRDTVVPGVAIATALMPPLCTAGYGLANGNWPFFLGASYLFLLNSLLIGLSTLILIRYLKFPKKEYVNPKVERRVKIYIAVFMVVIVAPSGWLFYKMTKTSIFENNAKQFVAEVVETSYDNIIVFPEYNFDYDNSVIELNIQNVFIDSATEAAWNRQKANYDLEKVEIEINQGEDFRAYMDKRIVEIKSGLEGNEKLIGIIEKKDREIVDLRDQIERIKSDPVFQKDPLELNHLLKGFRIDYPELEEISVNRGFSLNKKNELDTNYVLSVKFDSGVNPSEKEKIKSKISRRFKLELEEKTNTKQDSVRVITY